MKSQPFSRTGAQWGVEAMLERLAAKFPHDTPTGRLLSAELATLRRKGLGAFLLDTQALLDYWRGEAQLLQEITDVALLRSILAKAYAALGVKGAHALAFVIGPALDLGVCELCEGDLDAMQWCFGCHKKLCVACDKSGTCYPMCLACVPVWTPRRVRALFRTYLSLPREEQNEERWLQLQRQQVAQEEESPWEMKRPES
jgi:hypothetical protein